MTAASQLKGALSAVAWDGNVTKFCSEQDALIKVAASNQKLALWSKQLEQVDSGNPALCFVREMQVAGHLVAATTALAIYKAAAASCRTVVESALYYTYYRTHPAELATLVRSSKWYMSKTEIIDYHRVHTPSFAECQKHFPFVATLEPWYSEISAVIHGQIPGVWVTHTGLAEIAPVAQLQSAAIQYFEAAVDLVNKLLFCTIAQEFWGVMSTPAKKALLHGVPGQAKADLGLDAA